MKTENRGLICEIFKDRNGGANGGISEYCHSVLLLGVQKLDDSFVPVDPIFSEELGRPAVIIKERQCGGELYLAACEETEDATQVCFGGSFIYTSDSRFREISRYPIPLHDRHE